MTMATLKASLSPEPSSTDDVGRKWSVIPGKSGDELFQAADAQRRPWSTFPGTRRPAGLSAPAAAGVMAKMPRIPIAGVSNPWVKSPILQISQQYQ
jgi:hypothetical protein